MLSPSVGFRSHFCLLAFCHLRWAFFRSSPSVGFRSNFCILSCCHLQWAFVRISACSLFVRISARHVVTFGGLSFAFLLRMLSPSVGFGSPLGGWYVRPQWESQSEITFKTFVFNCSHLGSSGSNNSRGAWFRGQVFLSLGVSLGWKLAML